MFSFLVRTSSSYGGRVLIACGIKTTIGDWNAEMIWVKKKLKGKALILLFYY